MTEEWRRKSYYRTRVLIDSSRLLDPQFEDSMLCLTGPQLEMVRNLCEYLHRRSTFVAEYHQGYYLTPDEEDFDAIQAIVADLEESIMGCEEFTELLTGILAQTACTCNALQLLSTWGPGAGPLVTGLLDDGTLIETDPNGTTQPQDDDRCAIAQLVYWQAWELLTETIQPAQDALFEYLLPAAVAILASLLGGPVVGIPLGTITAWVTQFAKVWKEGKLVDVQNTWYANREEITCALYEGLATSYDAATAAAVEVIKEMEGLSPVDQVVFHALCGPWAIALQQAAWTAQSSWAVANVTPGYCLQCDAVSGSDWWALRLPESYTLTFPHTAGAYWLSRCIELTLPDGWICQGLIFEVTERTGCNLKRMSQGEAGCTGSGIWGNGADSELNTVQTYFAVSPTEIDEAECKAQLAPGSQTLSGITLRQGPLDISGGFQSGWNCTGDATIVFHYIVFRGSIPL